MPTLTKEQREVVIKVNQIWVARLPDGAVNRRIRILAPNPDGGWIYLEMPSDIHRVNTRFISVCPDFNLRYVFSLEKNSCEHKHTGDAYVDHGGFSPSTPNYYICTDCGDKFPNTGDDRFWFPKTLE